MGMIGITFLAVACVVHLAFKIEKTNIRLDSIMEEMQRCNRVHLLSPREDVIQAMGQPVKTEVVRSITGGLADRLYYRYQTVKVDHNPYIDVDQHFNKVMAIDCAFTRKDLKSVVKKGKVQMPKDEPLPTDYKRP